MSKWDAMYSESLWIDFMEGEMEASLAQDLKILLLSSRSDRALLEELKTTRAAVAAADDAAVPEDGLFYLNQTQNIMAAIADLDVAQAAKSARAKKSANAASAIGLAAHAGSRAAAAAVKSASAAANSAAMAQAANAVQVDKRKE